MSDAKAKIMAVLKKVFADDTELLPLLESFDVFTSEFSADGSGFDLLLDMVDLALDNATGKLTLTIAGENISFDITSEDSIDNTTVPSDIQDKINEEKENQKLANNKMLVFIDYNENSIYMMNLEGKDFTSFTPEPTGWLSSLVLSPDGQTIYYSLNRKLYSCLRNDSVGNLLIENADAPAISNDGTMIAYELRDILDHSNIYCKNLSAADATLVVSESGYSFHEPEWSPDGKTIYCVKESGNGPLWQEDIVRIDLNSEGKWGTPVNLTNTNDNEYRLSISPDGKKIAYIKETDVDGIEEKNIMIGEITSTGFENIVNLTENININNDPEYKEKEFGDPCWSPDGQSIFFTGEIEDEGSKDGEYIYKINIDKTGFINLTKDNTEIANEIYFLSVQK